MNNRRTISRLWEDWATAAEGGASARRNAGRKARGQLRPSQT